MGDGETGNDNRAEWPTSRRLLPPEDRVWRHPAEVAMEARQSLARRRAQRRRTSIAVFGGFAAAAGLLWLVQLGASDGVVTTNLVSFGSGDDEAPAVSTAPSTSLLEAFLVADRPLSSDIVVIRLSAGAEPVAGALRVRDGFVITSGRALAGAEEVLLTWGDQSEIGVVIGYDATTDVSVIRVAGRALAATTTDAREVVAGDVLTLSDPGTAQNTHTVVKAVSASERVDGEPIVGIVELDGRLGSVPPGSPAFDADGALVGMITATAADAPAAVVPIQLIRVVADEIIELGAATHPRLGLRARNPTDADGLGGYGSLVTALTVDGPAALGGVQVGDVIIEIGGESIESVEAMVAILRSHEPGDAVVVVVQRSGELVNCPVELGSQPDTTA